jgi:hypothetical protein
MATTTTLATAATAAATAAAAATATVTSLTAAATATPIAPSFLSITALIQKKIDDGRGKQGGEKDCDADEDVEDEEDADVHAVMKKPATQVVRKTSSASTLKRPAHALAAICDTRVNDCLKYKKDVKCGPRFYNEATIYTDGKRGFWRVKPGKGRRDDKKFNRGSDEASERDAWRLLVKYLKETF